MSKRHHPKQDEYSKEEDIVVFLMTNIYKQNKIDFYTNLDALILEDLISAPFTPHRHTREQQQFVLSLLKKNTFILSTAFAHDHFDHTRVFQFLLAQEITHEKMNALQEIFLPFCKKFPDKMLKLLQTHPAIKQALLQHIYTKCVFKLLYTAVFCSDRTHLALHHPTMQEILTCMQLSLFQFSPDRTRTETLPLFDSDDVPANYKDFLADLALNLATVELQLLLDQAQLLQGEFVQRLAEQLEGWERREKQGRGGMEGEGQYGQNVVQVWLGVLRVFESFKLGLSKQYAQQNTQLFHKAQALLLSAARAIAQLLPRLTRSLLPAPSSTLSYSSGEIVPEVGMLRYRTLQLMEKVLSINQLQSLSVGFQQFDFLPVAEAFLERHKWNNIVHSLVVKISQLLLSQDYKHFQERHIFSGNHTHGLFGNIVAGFRNRKYFFLHSMRMMDHGNRHHLYQLSRILVNQMKENNDLSYLLQHFKVWREFMEEDMKDYENRMNNTSRLPFEPEDKAPKLRIRQNSFDLSNSYELVPHHNRPLETFEQVVMRLREEEKWSPKPIVGNSNIMRESMAVNRLDSLRGSPSLVPQQQ